MAKFRELNTLLHSSAVLQQIQKYTESEDCKTEVFVNHFSLNQVPGNYQLSLMVLMVKVQTFIRFLFYIFRDSYCFFHPSLVENKLYISVHNILLNWELKSKSILMKI